MTKEAPAKILVVDDEPNVLMLLRATLSAFPYDVVYCSSPQEAIPHLANTQFDVVLTDHMMPGMTGIELLSIVSKTQTHACRFLLTANATLTAAVAAMRDGKLDRLIRKPWGTNALLHTVQEAIFEAQMRRKALAQQEVRDAADDFEIDDMEAPTVETPVIKSAPMDAAQSNAMEMLTDHFGF